MIAHQYIGINVDVVSGRHLAKSVRKKLTISIIQKNIQNPRRIMPWHFNKKFAIPNLCSFPIFTLTISVAKFICGIGHKTMKQKVSFLIYIVFLSVLILDVCLIPHTAMAQESKKTQDNFAAPHILEGKSFIGPTGEKGKKVHHEDVLRFIDGIFTSSSCFQYGFKGAPYTTTVEAGSIHFHAETISPTHGKIVWQGTLKGETLDVNYSWTKERWLWTTFREYWFKGSLVK